jgi:hypothetical protein
VRGWSSAALAAALLWLAATGRLNALTAGTGRPGLGVDDDRVPAGAAEFLLRVRATGPVFHTYEDGSYLIWRTPELPVLVDPRSALYGDAFLYQLDRAMENPAAFAGLDREFHFAWALLPRTTPKQRACISRLLQARWRLVHADHRDCLLARPGLRPDLPDQRERLANESAPESEFPRAEDFPRQPAWRSFWSLAPASGDLSEQGWFSLYQLVGNRDMARHHLARYLDETPAYGIYYAAAHAAYRDLNH